MSKTLLELTQEAVTKTRQMVNAEKNGGLTQREIADGAGVNFWWLIKFAQGSIDNPGLDAVQRLHDFLEERQSAA